MSGGRRRRVRAGLAAALLGLVLTDQGLRLATDDGWFLGTRVAPFHPPLWSPHQQDQLEHLRRVARDGPPGALLDPDLGWAPRAGTDHGLYRYDAHGGRASARPFPSERRPDVRRVVAVGCSFTRGDELPAEEAWLGRLHEGRADLDVLNLGMGGYGLDQALLRLERDGLGVDAEEVWLGWCPATSGRLTSVFPPVQRHTSGAVNLKPRFELDAHGDLLAVPLPVTDEAGLVALLEDPPALARWLSAHEQHAARHPLAYAPPGSSAWHASGLARLALTLLERGDRDVQHDLRDGSSELRGVLRGIFARLDRVAREHGLVARLVVLPAQPDLEAARRGARPWSEALAEARAAGLAVLDTSDALLAADLPDGELWAPGGHHAAGAAAVVAEALARTWLDGPRELTVATWNVHHGQRTDGPFDLDGQGAFVAALDAEVVLLQEVDRGTGRAAGADQAAHLARRADGFASFGEAMPYDGGSYGEGACSRRRPRSVRVHPLPARAGSEPRAALELEGLLGGRSVRVIGTHLDHLPSPADRAAQARVLLELLRADPRPAVLLGDLNADLGAPELVELAAEVDAALPDSTPTFPADAPAQALDHVLLWPRGAWEVVGWEVRDPGTLSDHRAVRVELRLRP